MAVAVVVCCLLPPPDARLWVTLVQLTTTLYSLKGGLAHRKVPLYLEPVLVFGGLGAALLIISLYANGHVIPRRTSA